MRRTLLLSSLALSLLVVAARAQVASIYVTSSNTRFNNVETGVITTGGNYQEQYANFWASGIGGGLTLNFLPVGPVRFGIDLRGSTRPGTPGADTGMLGFRIAARIPAIHIMPYVQASGGYIATRTGSINPPIPPGSTITTNPFNDKYAAYEIFGGIDVPLVRHLDLRAIEIGGGTGYTVGDTDNNNDYGVQTISLFSVNSGLVVHF